MITASIVVHKTPEWQLIKVLTCLKNSSVDIIYVIDNGPIGTLELICQNYPNVIYRRVKNRGYGAGHNKAIKEVLKDITGFHLVMNADVWWEGDIIVKLEKYMEDDPEVGVVMPKVNYPNGEIQYTCRLLPTPIDMFLRMTKGEKWAKKRMGRYLLKDHDHDYEVNCPYLLGSFLFFRNKALKEIDGFDERFFMYPEDIDITRRIHEKWKTMYWPGVSIIHEHQQASKKQLRMFRIHAWNMIKYFNKWGWFFDKKRKEFNKTLNEELIKKSLK